MEKNYSGLYQTNQGVDLPLIVIKGYIFRLTKVNLLRSGNVGKSWYFSKLKLHQNATTKPQPFSHFLKSEQSEQKSRFFINKY